MLSYSKNDAQLRPLQKSVIGSYQLTFKVKADKDATVSLLGAPGASWLAHYTLTIGHGDQTTLKVLNDTHDIIIEEPTQNILHPDEFRTFWLLWEDHKIRFGKGTTIESEQVLQYQDPSKPYIHSVAFSNSGDKPGVWELGTVDIIGE